MPILLVKVQWMPFYEGEDIVRRPWGRYEGPYHERFNFLCHDDRYYGYLRSAAAGGRVDIPKLGANEGRDRVNNVTVVFVAPQPVDGARPLLVVGYYRNASVFSDQIGFGPDRDVVNLRIVSPSATCIPEEERTFLVRGMWRSGMYRFADWLEDGLEERLLAYLSHMDQAEEIHAGLGWEWRVITTSERWERRSSVNLRAEMLANEEDHKCECCDYMLPEGANPSLRRSFEVHHKNPVAWIRRGDFRKIDRNDLAVVCANCHRAIHATQNMGYIGDMEGFRVDVLGMAPRG